MKKFENTSLEVKTEGPNTMFQTNMRVLCLFNSYWNIVRRNEIAPITGGEGHMLEVGKIWTRLGVNVEMVTTKSGYAVCRDHGLRVNSFVLPLDGNRLGVIASYLMRMFQGLLIAWKLRHEAICAYSSTDILPDILPALVVKFLNYRKPIMVCWVFHLVSHFSTRRGSKMQNIISFLSQEVSHAIMRRYSDVIFVDNSQVKAELNSIGFHKDRIHVVPLGIDKESIDNSEPIPSASYDACYLGRLHATKGVNDLADIWRFVTDVKKSAKLAVIGSDPTGSMLRKLQEKFRQYDLKGNVDFLGLVPRKSLFSVLKTCKIFLFPSYEEGWGIAVCEAMAAGLVPVVYDLPPYREFFQGGVVTVPIGDRRALANAVIELLSDEEKRIELKQKAVLCASQYSWDNTASRELQVIRNRVAMSRDERGPCRRPFIHFST